MRPSRPPDLATRFERQREAFAHDPTLVANPDYMAIIGARRSGTALFHPPYGKTFDLLLRVLARIA